MNDARVAVSRLPFRFWLLLAGTLGGLASPARAEQNVSAFVGGWAYELSGEITNGATLDFDDLVSIRSRELAELWRGALGLLVDAGDSR